MRKICLLLMLLILAMRSGAQTVLTLDGKYTGENLYVQNPVSTGGVLCTDSVYVNGTKTDDDLNSTAFEIRLADKALKPYEPLHVQIYHKTGCTPKVLTNFIHHRSYIRVEQIWIDSSGLLKWTTRNDSSLYKMSFKVEQYVWNKWIVVGEVEQTDIEQTQFEFMPELHSGTNRFRVKAVDYSGKPFLSTSVTVESTTGPVTFECNAGARKITFSNITRYEVYDKKGYMVSKGYGRYIELVNLMKGDYFINYDCKMGEFKL